MPFLTDEALWYNVGVWGELGFAVPNFGDDPRTLNSGIYYLTQVMGRNLQAVMLHPDADLRTPPSINTLTRVHKLVIRSRQILGSRLVAPGDLNMESPHTTPAPTVHLIYPLPYFRVRNIYLKEWCGLGLTMLAEAMQHTENRKAFEISRDFAGLIGQYLMRIYCRMATELFGVPAETARALDFTLTPDQLAAYDPSVFFTSTEMIDTIAPLHMAPTEDDLRVLTDGIPATQLVGLMPWPDGNQAGASGGHQAPTSTTSFAPPPGA